MWLCELETLFKFLVLKNLFTHNHVMMQVYVDHAESFYQDFKRHVGLLARCYTSFFDPGLDYSSQQGELENNVHVCAMHISPSE